MRFERRHNELVLQKNCDEVGHARVGLALMIVRGDYYPSTVIHQHCRNLPCKPRLIFENLFTGNTSCHSEHIVRCLEENNR